MKATFALLLLAITTATLHAQPKKWTLRECVEYAWENNISIQQSELDLETNQVDWLDAVGNFLPSLNGQSNLSANTGLTTNPTTGILQNITQQSFSGNLNAGYTIFDGLRNINQLNRAKLTALAGQYRLDNIKDDISLAVANAYLQILFNRERLKLAITQYGVTEQDLKRTQELVDNGVLPRGDLLEIEATAAAQQQQIVNAENNLALSKLSLAQLLLIRDYQNFDIADETFLLPTSTILENSPKEIFEKALTFRNDIKQSEQNVELAKTDLKIARGSLYPTLNAFFNYNARYTDAVNLGFAEQLYTFDGIAYGLSLNVPIFNGFSAKNNVKRNKIALERSSLQLEQDKLDLENTINQAWNDTQNALKSFEAAQKTLDARRLAFEYARERYSVGLMNSFDFSQAQIRVDNAEADLVRTKYDYIFRLKVLEFYFGIPLDQI